MSSDPQGWLATFQQLLDGGRLDEAEQLARQRLAQAPHDAAALHALGLVLTRRDDQDGAEDLVCRAIELQPSAAFFTTLGGIHGAAGRADESALSFELALKIQPDFAPAVDNLAVLNYHRYHVDEAITGFRRMHELQPHDPMHLMHLAAALALQGRHAQVLDTCRRAIEIAPHRLDLFQLLYCMWFTDLLDRQTIIEQHRIWGQAAGHFARDEPHDNDPDPDRRLRIGYVSPDLREHVIGYFMQPILGAHDRSAVETFCYFHGRADFLTERLKASAHHWIDTHALDDDQLAERIRADRIDVLIDLSLQMTFSRLMLFTRRPAPVQATYLAYPGTSGLPQMDYRITDRIMEPASRPDGWLGPERLARLSECYWCYRPPPQAPPPAAAPPSARNGYITFACTNNFLKVTPSMLALWGTILRRIPNARLRLSLSGGAEHNRSMLPIIEAAGLDLARVDLLGRLGYQQFLAAYNDIDIALDTFPYNGGTTTFDALYLGVPVITRAGELPVSRMGLTIMTNLGLSELVADSPEQYLERAVSLAHDPARLAAFKRDLRPRLLQSHLTDAAGFTRNLETTYRWMWQQWCASPGRAVTGPSAADA